jgi:hypothetical protein
LYGENIAVCFKIYKGLIRGQKEEFFSVEPDGIKIKRSLMG